MKYDLLKLLMIISKQSLYALVLICVGHSALLAEKSAGQSINDVYITVKIEKGTINDAFKAIENKTEFTFAYGDNISSIKKKYDFVYKNQSVAEILKDISRRTRINFKQINGTISAKYISRDSVPNKEIQSHPPDKENNLPDKTIKGKVTDEKGEPLPGVSIREKDTNNGTITDADGNYSLQVTDSAILVISSVGFKTVEVSTQSRTRIDLQLEVEWTSLNEVVVVGYGSTQRTDLTGTIASVAANDLEEFPATTIDQSLIGKMTGVQVSSVSGEPGAGAKVYIRGFSQIRGDNQPLYVIDGVPVVVNPQFGNSVGNFQNRENPLLMINPNDVERIDVLKDASASAIYGSRASNGVIIITTKRGKANQKPQLSFNVRASVQNPVSTYDMMNAAEWRDYNLAAAERNPTSAIGAEILADPDGFFYDEDVDWQDAVVNNNALWMDYNLTFRGGTDVINYATAINVTNADGIMLGSEFDRYGLRLNLDGSVSDRVSVGTSMSYNYSIRKGNGFGTAFGASSLNAAASFRPDLGRTFPDGSISGVPSTLYIGGLERNPVDGIGNVTRNAQSQNTLLNLYGTVDIIEGLNIRTEIGLGISDDIRNDFTPSYAVFNPSRNSGDLIVSDNSTRTTVWTNTLNYQKTFADVHSVNVAAGVEFNAYYINVSNVTYSNFPDDDVNININSAGGTFGNSSQTIEQGLNSIFGRVNYKYDDRYLATFTIRRDGSNKFGPNNQYGIFPSGALAWNIHNESFLEGISSISQLKLRASYGVTGSDNLPAFTFVPLHGAGENNESLYGPDLSVGLVPTALSNPDIRWEETRQLDLGLSFGLFKNRLYGEFVYFEKNTSGLILLVPVDGSTGFANVDSNVGDMENKGWEIGVGGDILQLGDFNWNSSVNISFIKNKITALNGGQTSLSGNEEGIIEGEPIGSFFGYNVLRIAQTQQEIIDLNTAAGGLYYPGLSEPGDYIYEDTNGDGVITADDRVVLGDINPDYYGGWNNTLTYKGFELTFNFQFVKGVDKLWTESDNNLTGSPTYSNLLNNVVRNAWDEDNTGAKYARLGSPTHGDTNSKDIVDASFSRLRTIGLAYSLPPSLTGKVGISNARVYLQGNNVFTITDYPGLDPETVGVTRGTIGGTTDTFKDDGGNIPLARTWTIGLNLTF